MITHLRANLWLLLLTVVLCSVLYPLVLWAVGQTAFPTQAQGSLLTDAQGRPIGARLIAQPFTADEYFQPRPSAVAYNAAASGASNWAASNCLLRDRVARQLGPVVKYRTGPRQGQLVGPDVERWFQQDRFGGQPGIVAQWAAQHPTLAQNWIKADKLNTAYVDQWQRAHADAVSNWHRTHPGATDPQPEDLAGPFFADYARCHPGSFPSAVEQRTSDGRTEKRIEPVRQGPEIQSTFFDMWLTEHPQADLQRVPADAVMASASGLDPDITMSNALWQLDHVAAAWAKKRGVDDTKPLRTEIERLLWQKCHAPLNGLAGAALVNVLEINLALRQRYQEGPVAAAQ